MSTGVTPREAACSACREITERSNLYERWLMAENHADGATLEVVAAARGFCSQHARRLLERDPDVAAPIAHFVLRTIAAHIELQQRDRHGYRDALDAQRRCPWCLAEGEALSYALTDPKRSRSLCPPHQRAARLAARAEAAGEPPLTTLEPLTPTSDDAPGHGQTWWSPQIDELTASLLASCPACAAAREASRLREAFLRRGPVQGEHWEPPTLCAAHDAALGAPRTADYERHADGVLRPCDWCLPIRRAAQSSTQLFSIAYREPAFRLAYAHTHGLCVPHAAATLHLLTASRQEFVVAMSVRIETMVWELEERASRRSWQLRDQMMLRHAADLSHRAWWLIAGGTFRYGPEERS